MNSAEKKAINDQLATSIGAGLSASVVSLMLGSGGRGALKAFGITAGVSIGLLRLVFGKTHDDEYMEER